MMTLSLSHNLNEKCGLKKKFAIISKKKLKKKPYNEKFKNNMHWIFFNIRNLDFYNFEIPFLSIFFHI